jgi:four helix bundle protein
MAAIQSFRDLDVYRAARDQARRLFELTKTFPREERYSLIDQVRRSSRAVGALVAEAWAFRRYEAAFVNKLHQAMGEANETQSWLDSALDCDYITAEVPGDLDGNWQRIGGMLRRMAERAESFRPRDERRE